MKARKPLLALVAAMLLAAALFVFTSPSRPHDILLSGISAAPIEGQPGALAVFLTIENTGGPDRLLAARSGDATRVQLSETGHALAIPANSTPVLAADGAHIRLDGVAGELGDGRLIPVTLKFERAGPVSGKARLVAPRHEGEAHDMGLHGMGDIHRVAEGEPTPALELTISPDGDGWLITAQTGGFSFDKDKADGPHVPGTGHGHLYLNGLKLQRLYTSSARINALPPGEHQVTVTLNTNDHRAYVVDGKPVTATAAISAP